MPKGHKTSASPATQKKHARKAAAAQGLPLPKAKNNNAKGKGKGKNKEPRKKGYIPPFKPAPIEPDPLDALGLAKVLPPELVIVLRKLAKKDTVTKRKALEELQADWVSKVGRQVDESGYDAIETHLLTALPVWLHALPVLFLHPSRRLRFISASVHLSLLQIPSLREQVIYFLKESASETQVERILGSWCIVAQDLDRQVAAQAQKAFDLTIITREDSASTTTPALRLDAVALNSMLTFIRHALFHPSRLYSDLNAVQTTSPPPHQIAARKGGPKQSPQAQAARKKELEQQTKVKIEEEEESEEDRQGRLRVGALGALRWLLESEIPAATPLLSDLAAKSIFWTTLYHGEKAPFHTGWGESLGYKQPAVRKAAWTYLGVCLKMHINMVEGVLSLLSKAVLRSAWVEPDANVRVNMWQSLLTFLTKFPKCWDWDGDRVKTETPSHNADDEADDDEDESSDDDEGDQDDGNVADANTPSDITDSPGYRSFLQFLEQACSGSPIHGYPTVVVIISTIPPSVLGSSSASWTTFFASFWAALDNRALTSLDRTTASAAFVSALLECVAFLAKRWRSATTIEGKPDENATQEIMRAIESEIKHLMEELMSRRLRAEGEAAGKCLAATSQSLDKIDQRFFGAAWEPMTAAMSQAVHQADLPALEITISILRAWKESQTGSTGALMLLEILSQDLTQKAIECVNRSLAADEATPSQGLEALTSLLSNFPETIFQHQKTSQAVDDLLREKLSALLVKQPNLVTAYFASRNDKSISSGLWCQLLLAVSAGLVEGRKQLAVLLRAAKGGLLPDYLQPHDEELDNFLAAIVSDAVDGSDQEALSIAKQVLQYPDHFMSPRAYSGILHNILFAFSEKIGRLVRDSDLTLEPSDFSAPLDVLHSIVEAGVALVMNDEFKTFLPNFFMFGFLVPRTMPVNVSSHSAFQMARKIWNVSLSSLDDDSLSTLRSSTISGLKDLMMDLDARPTPQSILDAASKDLLGFSVDALEELLASREQIEDMLESMPSSPLDPSLVVIEPLIPPASTWPEDNGSHFENAAYDAMGLSEYARVTVAAISIVVDDRQSLRHNIWLLQHFTVLSIAANELLNVPDAKSAFFSPSISKSALQDLVERTHKIATFILSAPTDDGWHARVVRAIMQGSETSVADGTIEHFITTLLIKAQAMDTIRESLVIHAILQQLFNEATKHDADHWLQLARTMEKKSPQTALAITYAITRFAPMPSAMDRYRNELGAGILGISASRANTEGLLLLRRLSAVAPDPESDVVFLPQTRAVNFMRQCQDWITSEEDVDEEVECEMTLLFFHLAPIVQNVHGSHWDLIFDIVENNLENCSFDDSSTLVLLARTLNLLIAVQELAISNKALRELCFQRALSVLTQVKELVIKSKVSSHASTPRTTCWELALSIVKDLPTKLIDHRTLPSMCHLILDPSILVQKMAYALLLQAAGPWTEYVVVEAGVDSDSTELALPNELLHVVQIGFEQWEGEDDTRVFGYLLAWMMVFDLFKDASLKVKIGYANHMRNLNLIGTNFLPIIFELLDIDTRQKPFALDMWNVDEYYVHLYDSDSPLSSKLLAAHLFYRALLNIPSLISNWWTECKDLQLSRSVANLTMRYFSPLLIAAELAHVRDPVAAEELAGENWKIKVSSAVNEVSAEFIVDEQQLEIAVRLPGDYPLHTVEVKDVRRVGVDEARWRGWLFAVQQIVSYQNGGIVDGLAIFKKNVTHHFENQTECAICYSIIGVSDLSFPNKMCRTCKNKFHSSCLYKWFSTSHTSACPLCRSDII